MVVAIVPQGHYYLHHDLDSGVRPRNDNFLFCNGVGWGGKNRTYG